MPCFPRGPCLEHAPGILSWTWCHPSYSTDFSFPLGLSTDLKTCSWISSSPHILPQAPSHLTTPSHSQTSQKGCLHLPSSSLTSSPAFSLQPPTPAFPRIALGKVTSNSRETKSRGRFPTLASLRLPAACDIVVSLKHNPLWVPLTQGPPASLVTLCWLCWLLCLYPSPSMGGPQGRSGSFKMHSQATPYFSVGARSPSP